jgi:hypothetical protein
MQREVKKSKRQVMDALWREAKNPESHMWPCSVILVCLVSTAAATAISDPTSPSKPYSFNITFGKGSCTYCSSLTMLTPEELPEALHLCSTWMILTCEILPEALHLLPILDHLTPESLPEAPHLLLILDNLDTRLLDVVAPSSTQGLQG